MVISSKFSKTITRQPFNLHELAGVKAAICSDLGSATMNEVVNSTDQSRVSDNKFHAYMVELVATTEMNELSPLANTTWLFKGRKSS